TQTPSPRSRTSATGRFNQLRQQREARPQPVQLVVDAGAVVEPLDAQEERTVADPGRDRADEAVELGDALARVPVEHLEAAAVIGVVGLDRAEDVVLDVAGGR